MVHHVAGGKNIIRLDLHTAFLVGLSDDDEREGAAGASLERALDRPMYTKGCIQIIVHEQCLQYEFFRQVSITTS